LSMMAIQPAPTSAPVPLAVLERDHIIRTIEYCKGNMSDTARLLGIGRSTLYDRITSYGINTERVRNGAK
jgi:transcriptional regulator of acetoin/glycerol metabolism